LITSKIAVRNYRLYIPDSGKPKGVNMSCKFGILGSFWAIVYTDTAWTANKTHRWGNACKSTMYRTKIEKQNLLRTCIMFKDKRIMRLKTKLMARFFCILLLLNRI